MALPAGVLPQLHLRGEGLPYPSLPWDLGSHVEVPAPRRGRLAGQLLLPPAPEHWEVETAASLLWWPGGVCRWASAVYSPASAGIGFPSLTQKAGAAGGGWLSPGQPHTRVARLPTLTLRPCPQVGSWIGFAIMTQCLPGEPAALPRRGPTPPGRQPLPDARSFLQWPCSPWWASPR